MEQITLRQVGNEFVYSPEICVYDGESVKIALGETDFTYAKALVYVNKIYLGPITGVLGIHSSRLVNGLNEIEFCFYDSENKLIKKSFSSLTKRPSIRGVNSIEEEFTLLNKALLKLTNEVEQLNDWKEQIDLERSGY